MKELRISSMLLHPCWCQMYVLALCIKNKSCEISFVYVIGVHKAPIFGYRGEDTIVFLSGSYTFEKDAFL